MRVLIENFRCFKEKKLEFPNGNISLLKGESGKGKSTILESIKWCLFSGTRNIYPLNFKPSSSNQTKVTLEFPNSKLRYIVRSQPSEQIKVYVQKDGTKPEDKDFDILESEAAQRYIESVFGTKDIWFVSSYLSQGERSPLMTNSNSDKMNLLCEILFGNKFNSETNNYDNPDWYTNKIEKQLNETASALAARTADYNSIFAKANECKQNYKPKMNVGKSGSNGAPYWDHIPKDEEITELISRLDIVKSSLGDINKKMLEVKGKETEKEMLTLRLNEIESKIKAFEAMNSDDMVKYLQETRENITCLESSIREMTSLYLSILAKEQNRDFLIEKIKEADEIKTRKYNSSFETLSIEEMTNQKTVKRETKTKLESDLMQVKIKESEMSTLTSRLSTITQTLNDVSTKLSGYTNLNVEELRKQIQNTRAYAKLKEIQDKEPENISFDYNEDNITEMQRSLPLFISEYNKNLEICTKYNLTAGGPITSQVEETVSKQLSSVQQVLIFAETMKKELEIKEKHTQNDNKIDELSGLILELKDRILIEESEISSSPLLNLESYITLKTEIQLNSGDSLQCPDCSSALEVNHSPEGMKLCKISRAKYSKEEGKKRIDIINKLSDLLKQMKVKESELEYLQKEKAELTTPKPEYISDQVVNTYTPEVVGKYKKFYDEVSQFKAGVNNTYAKTAVEAESLLSTIPKVQKRKAWERDYEQAKKTLSIDDSLEILSNEMISKYERDIMDIPMLISQQQQSQHTVEELTKQVESAKLFLSENKSSLELNSEIQELSNEVNSLEDMIKDFVEYQSVKTKFENLNKELSEAEIKIPESSSKVSENIESLKLKCQSLKETLSGYSQYEIITQEYNEVKTKLSSIIIEESSESLSNKFDTANSDINSLETWISEGKQLVDLINYTKELELVKAEVFKLNAEHAYLNRLKMLIIEVTNSSLQNLVDSINECTNNVLEDLFENNIRVELKLFKEQKKTNNLKPVINFSIFYNNSVYDNIMGLSGGEKDRISLALTIALACVNPSPILFLDECMSSLNTDLRENCIEALKKFVIGPTGKTCINIEHSGIEGYYDSIISLS